jgi:hypothetical protein
MASRFHYARLIEHGKIKEISIKYLVLLDAVNLKLSCVNTVEILMERAGASEVGRDRLATDGERAAAYVEGDDDAGGVVVGQLDGSAEVSVVVRRLGYEPGA